MDEINLFPVESSTPANNYNWNCVASSTCFLKLKSLLQGVTFIRLGIILMIMDTNLSVDWRQLLNLALIVAGVGLVICLLLLGWIVWRVRRINIPPGADAITTLRSTPLVVVVLLDLLDFSLDFLAA
jgi:hypothetical protein